MAMKTIGILDSTLMGGRDEEMRAFYNGLAGTGRNGSNTSVCHKWADNDYTQLGPLAQQLIDLNVSVIVAAGGPASAIAAQVKTTTIPIVFTTITDPRPSGLVRNLDTPEANVTGTFGHTTDLDDERMSSPNQDQLASFAIPSDLFHGIPIPLPSGSRIEPRRTRPTVKRLSWTRRLRRKLPALSTISTKATSKGSLCLRMDSLTATAAP
jgi:hypothetical protein